jgi:hypothetical protein
MLDSPDLLRWCSDLMPASFSMYLQVPATYADLFAVEPRVSALLFKTLAVHSMRSRRLAKVLRGE